MNPIQLYDGMIHGPQRLRPHEIATLTDRQIDEWYNRDIDEKTGAVKPAPPLVQERVVETLEETKNKFYAIGTTLGVSEEELEKGWAKTMERRERGEI